MNTLNQRIARFYDLSSQLWEDLWGEHMHHGFYQTGRIGNVGRVDAQEELIERLLELGNVKSAKQILDVGCGIGGSTRYLAKKFQSEAVGITLSPFQAKRANNLSEQPSGNARLKFEVADAQNIPFESNRFDLVWSMESAEHFPRKSDFLQHAFRVLKPGGTLLLATWCCNQRPLTSVIDRTLLHWINRAYALPAWVIGQEYVELAKDAGFENIRTDDWSRQVKPFWGEVLRQTLSLRGIKSLIKAGPIVMRGAAVVPLMMFGFHRGTIRFFAMSATKLKTPFENQGRRT